MFEEDVKKSHARAIISMYFFLISSSVIPMLISGVFSFNLREWNLETIFVEMHFQTRLDSSS